MYLLGGMLDGRDTHLQVDAPKNANNLRRKGDSGTTASPIQRTSSHEVVHTPRRNGRGGRELDRSATVASRGDHLSLDIGAVRLAVEDDDGVAAGAVRGDDFENAAGAVGGWVAIGDGEAGSGGGRGGSGRGSRGDAGHDGEGGDEGVGEHFEWFLGRNR